MVSHCDCLDHQKENWREKESAITMWFSTHSILCSSIQILFACWSQSMSGSKSHANGFFLWSSRSFNKVQRDKGIVDVMSFPHWCNLIIFGSIVMSIISLISCSSNYSTFIIPILFMLHFFKLNDTVFVIFISYGSSIYLSSLQLLQALQSSLRFNFAPILSVSLLRFNVTSSILSVLNVLLRPCTLDLYCCCQWNHLLCHLSLLTKQPLFSFSF